MNKLFSALALDLTRATMFMSCRSADNRIAEPVIWGNPSSWYGGSLSLDTLENMNHGRVGGIQ